MPQSHSVSVIAPSRLHFGLLSFGHPDMRQFGGVGVMIDRPGLKLRIQAAETFETCGPMQDRLREAALQWQAASFNGKELRCKVELISAPRLHAGLGVGTQLALAVAAGLNAFHELATPAIADLAASVGRGVRSAVGTYGFVKGGLIAERGKLPTDVVSPLLERVALPSDWRFVLISQPGRVGLSGATEQTAFDRLPPVPSTVTERLTEILCDQILPAAKSANFMDFSKAVYEFGFLAGTCFESVQGSAYNGAALESLVKHVRAIGVRGVGQSSWGPTIYCLCESESSALALADNLRADGWCHPSDLAIASPDNQGACVSTSAAVP